MNSSHGLEVVSRVPVGVNEDEPRGTDEVQADTACLRTEQEENWGTICQTGKWRLEMQKHSHRLFCDDLLNSST